MRGSDSLPRFSFFVSWRNLRGRRVFVLSGFLITGILLNDIEQHGTIRFKEFYIRRARRLLPALFVMLLMTIFLWLFVWKRPGFFKAAIAVIGYYANWTSVRAMGLMPHTWSLSVEEQLYLAWPVVLLIAFRQKAFIGTVILRITVVITLARAAFYLLNSPLAHPCSTLARLDGLLIGCACAAFLRYRPQIAQFWTGRRGSLIAVACGAALAILLAFPPTHSVVPLLLLAPSLVALYSAAVILYLASGGKSFLDHPALIALGKRSYGLYLYHLPIIHAFPEHSIILRIAATFAVAWLSYKYIEAPFLRHRPTKKATNQMVAVRETDQLTLGILSGRLESDGLRE
jgi:peptidoglycan/LPS O-acetylase OafA/YrhL